MWDHITSSSTFVLHSNTHRLCSGFLCEQHQQMCLTAVIQQENTHCKRKDHWSSEKIEAESTLFHKVIVFICWYLKLNIGTQVRSFTAWLFSSSTGGPRLCKQKHLQQSKKSLGFKINSFCLFWCGLCSLSGSAPRAGSASPRSGASRGRNEPTAVSP